MGDSSAHDAASEQWHEQWHDFERQVRATADRLRSIPIARITDATLRAHRDLCLIIVGATPDVPKAVLGRLPGAFPKVAVSALADQFLVVAGDFAHAARQRLEGTTAPVTYAARSRSARNPVATNVAEGVDQGSVEAAVVDVTDVVDVTGAIRRFRLDHLR